MNEDTEKTCTEQIDEDRLKQLKAAAGDTYNDKNDEGCDNEMITRFIPMVHKVVQRVVTYIKPPLSYEDLVSAGVTGLVKAARDYDASHQAVFKTYAYIRIRGAILDELRNFSLLPANVDKLIREGGWVGE